MLSVKVNGALELKGLGGGGQWKIRAERYGSGRRGEAFGEAVGEPAQGTQADGPAWILKGAAQVQLDVVADGRENFADEPFEEIHVGAQSQLIGGEEERSIEAQAQEGPGKEALRDVECVFGKRPLQVSAVDVEAGESEADGIENFGEPSEEVDLPEARVLNGELAGARPIVPVRGHVKDEFGVQAA